MTCVCEGMGVSCYSCIPPCAASGPTTPSEAQLVDPSNNVIAGVLWAFVTILIGMRAQYIAVCTGKTSLVIKHIHG